MLLVVLYVNRCDNTYRLYLSVISGQWTLSSKKLPTLSTSVASSLFGSVSTRNGQSYALAPAVPSNYSLVSQVFSIALYRPVLDNDVSVFETTFKSLLQQQLPTGSVSVMLFVIELGVAVFIKLNYVFHS